ncbi:MAG: IclR family transcriptional regulator [Chloroflexota bacterium]
MTVATERTGSLSRGLQIIEILADGRDGLPLTEIASKAGLSKSSTHRLLQVLLQEGFVTQDGEASHYRLSLKLLALSSNLIAGLGLDQLVRPLLEELSQATKQTVHLALWDSSVAVYAQKIDPPSSIRMYSQVGKRVPMYCTGLGKAILAFLPEERAKEVVAVEELKRHTPNTITKSTALLEHLSLIRSRGYALDEEEHEEGIRCIAAPLLDRQSRVLGAVSLATLAFRVDKDTMLSWWPQLRDCAQQIATILEHHSP